MCVARILLRLKIEECQRICTGDKPYNSVTDKTFIMSNVLPGIRESILKRNHVNVCGRGISSHTILDIGVYISDERPHKNDTLVHLAD